MREREGSAVYYLKAVHPRCVNTTGIAVNNKHDVYDKKEFLIFLDVRVDRLQESQMRFVVCSLC